jgi:flavin-dependent dehydrogenase
LSQTVAVVGAGPAGAVAAHRLARAGWRVTLIDRASPRAFKIGESLPGAAGRLLASMDLPPPGEEHLRLGGNLSAWGSDELTPTDFLNDPDGAGWRLDRPRFDAELRTAAVEAGAIPRRARLRALSGEAGDWRLTLDDGEALTVNWLVDASGRAGAISRRLGIALGPDEGLVALYAVGRSETPIPLARTLVETCRQGWWYAARLPDDRVLAALHVLPADAPALLRPGAWQAALAQTLHISEALAGVTFPQRPKGAPAGTTTRAQVAGPGWIACGDAALAFDPVSSQGIYSALHGGLTAARALLDGGVDAYAARLAEIEIHYRRRHKQAYATERRWPDEPFWRQALAPTV